MTKKGLQGIDGVLGNLISTTSQETDLRPSIGRQPKHENLQRARLGRPPGRSDNAHFPKEKVTLQISAKLAAEYRDWSWDARCSLSALVEKALAEYFRRR